MAYPNKSPYLTHNGEPRICVVNIIEHVMFLHVPPIYGFHASTGFRHGTGHVDCTGGQQHDAAAGGSPLEFLPHGHWMTDLIDLVRSEGAGTNEIPMTCGVFWWDWSPCPTRWTTLDNLVWECLGNGSRGSVGSLT